MTLNSENLKRLDRLSNIKINQDRESGGTSDSESDASQNDDEFINCDMDVDEDVNEELESKMGNRQSISESSGSGAFRKKNKMENLKHQEMEHYSLKSYARNIMKVTNKDVLSISGINMVKRILLKHLELMAVCQSHSFDIFVSLTNLLRFYTYIVANVFLGRSSYDTLMNDVIMFGYYPDSEGHTEMVFTDEEKDRANQHMMVQQRYELLKEEVINMQTFAETSGYVNNPGSGGVL